MRLISCHIANFGRCHDLTLHFQEGFNEFLHENGWGKTTVIAFIRVMLYGFMNENVRKDAAYMNERERYRPWQGGPYGGSLTFKDAGVTYEASLICAENKKNDDFCVREVRTGLETDRYDRELGRAFWGIDAETFLRSMCIAQRDCRTQVNDEMRLRFMGQDADPDADSYERAKCTFKDLLNEYSPERKTGKIYRLRAEVSQLEMNIQYPETAAKSAGNETLDMILSQCQETRLSEDDEERLMELNSRLGNAPEPKELSQMLELAEEREERLQHILQLQQEAARSQEEDEEEPKDLSQENSKGIKGGILCIVFAVVMLVGGLFLGLNHFLGNTGYIVAGLGGVMMLVGILLVAARLRRLSSPVELTSDSESTQRTKALTKYLWENREWVHQTDQMLAEYLTRYGITPVHGKESLQIMELKNEGQELIRLRKLASTHGKARAKLNDLILKMKEELTHKRETLDKYSTFYESITKASEYLEIARRQVNVRYKEPIARSLRQYIACVLEEKVGEISLDANLKLGLIVDGFMRDARSFSEGYQDLYGLCMRLAILDAMYPDKKPPLILDDPFASLDEHKVAKGMELLEMISRHYQVLYFTCNEHRT